MKIESESQCVKETTAQEQWHTAVFLLTQGNEITPRWRGGL